MANNEGLIQVDIPQRKNMFALEGIDGSGKSTQSENITRRLEGLGITVARVASPSDGVIGSFVRQNMRKLDSWERNALFLMDFIHTLKEHPDSKEVLIWDRYVASGYTSNKDMTLLQAVQWLSSLPQPTRTYLLDIEPSAVIETRSESVHDHSSDTSWQDYKRARYLELIDLFPGQIQLVDASRNPEEITELITKDILLNIEES